MSGKGLVPYPVRADVMCALDRRSRVALGNPAGGGGGNRGPWLSQYQPTSRAFVQFKTGFDNGELGLGYARAIKITSSLAST
jgi:hypothetical protein